MKLLPGLILLVMVGILFMVINEIPEAVQKSKEKQTYNERQVVETKTVQTENGQERMYSFTFKQLCGLFGVFAIFGALVTYLTSVRFLRFLYLRNAEALGEELRQQYQAQLKKLKRI
ncbi:MAG: hypothetical protein Q7T50_03930 [Candidatus Magasanikbacteria bacterium]|nr:hypothetical protein [Candidatus Magasanikbacteria bacterium]